MNERIKKGMKKIIAAIITTALMLSSLIQGTAMPVLADEDLENVISYDEETITDAADKGDAYGGEQIINTMPVLADEASENVISNDDEIVTDEGDAYDREQIIKEDTDRYKEDEIATDTGDADADTAFEVEENEEAQNGTGAGESIEAYENKGTDQPFLAEIPPADGEMYTREAGLLAGLPGVYATKAYPGENKDTATIGIPSVSKKTLTLENGPTTETPAIIMGAATGYEIKTGPVDYDILKERIAPYSYFRYGIIDEQVKEPSGEITTHKKMTGFDGSYYIIRVDVSEIIKKYIGEDGLQGEGKYLHVKQTDNKALMVASGMDRSTFSDALGNKTGAYSLANNAAALKDTDGLDMETPYFDVVVLSSGKLAAGADAGSSTAPSADIKLNFYVDDTEDYAPEIVPLDPNNMPTFPYTVGDRTFQTETDYNNALLAKFFDDNKATEENNASSYKVMGSDLEIDVTVDEQENGEETLAEFWSLTNAIAYMPYNKHVIKLICEVPVLEGLMVEGNREEGLVRSINFDVNSFDIQIANNTEQKTAGLTVGEYAQFRIMDGTNTSGAELAIGNNATMDIRGIMMIDESCTLEVEYDAATITDPTQEASNAVNGEITIRDGGQLVNYGVINIEGSEGKPHQPNQQEQEGGQSVITDMKASDLVVENGGLLLNFGCMSVKGILYDMGEVINYGRYDDIMETHDPDKGTKYYHKGIQVTWKDDVTQEGVVPGGIYVGYLGEDIYNPNAKLSNNGDIVLVPGELHVFGKIFNYKNAYLYVCDVDEAVIPITPDPSDPLTVEKRVAVDPPKASVFKVHEEKNGYMENYGRIGKAKVYVISNGVLGDLTPEWKDISKAEVVLSAESFTYNGKTQKPTVKSVTLDGAGLTEGKDYDVVYSHVFSTNAGEYSVAVIGKGDYCKEKAQTYKIEAADLSGAEAVLSGTSFAYSGSVNKPAVESVKLDGRVLKEGTDYDVSYSDPDSKDAGSYDVTVTGKGNYAGEKTEPYEITKLSLNNASVYLSAASFTYNGKTKKPTVSVVTLNGKVLTEDTDYTVVYENESSINAGTYEIAVKGKGNYEGEKAESYKINKASINGMALVLSKTSFTYNGSVQKPTIKTVGGKKLVSGTDYTAVWSNSKSKTAGKYTVKVTGKGNYTGTSAAAAYTINKAANTMTVAAKTANVSAAKLKSGNVTVKRSKVLSVSKAQGTVTYSKVSGNSKITINKTTGNVTVKKGLAKGTYKVKVSITAAGNTNYKNKTVKKTFTIAVK